MGARQSKMDGSHLPSTPLSQNTSQLLNVNFNADNNLDPRSPSGYRTPINVKNNGINTNTKLPNVEMPENDPNNDNALELLRKRFFKTFTCNINDPRSPSSNFNRTPLVFDDSLEKSLSLDDTFADLFIESHMPNKLLKIQSEEVSEDKYEKYADVDMPEVKVMHVEKASSDPHTPKSFQQQIDPRSPSVGVERTPIIFTDDESDEKKEDIMLEGILATLSLNLNNSASSSVVSMGSQNVKNDSQGVPVNKHLDRVRVGKKSSPKIKHFKSKRRTSKQKIYEDQENHTPTAPKFKFCQTDKNVLPNGKRTPLGCVRNRNGMHARSRSVESSVKSIKTRLVLTSFDDTLNPTENDKVPNLLITQKASKD